MILRLHKVNAQLVKLRAFPPLLARIAIGTVFFASGWIKTNHLSTVVSNFERLGIPFAQVQAPFVASIELFGGGFLILGFLTRLVSIPLIVTMGVAIITAKWVTLAGATDLFGLSEFLYIVLLIWLIVGGPGPVSLDYLFFKRRLSDDS